MIPVSIFNASALAAAIQVNQAPQPVRIGGTNGAIGWTPQRALGNQVGLDPSGAPGPNVLAIGPNNVVIAPQGSVAPSSFTLVIPGKMQWTALQLYIFFDTMQTVSWMVLNNGSYVTSGYVTA